MELIILNQNRERVGIIDEIESLVWSERYYECGDFELIVYPNQNNVAGAVQGYFLEMEESDRLMLIEDVNILTNPVDGNRLIIKGRSIEIFLDRRIIWNPIKFENAYFQDVILTLLNDNVLNPINEARKMDIVEFEASTDPYILGIVVNNQYWGDSLYKVIVDLCVGNRVGFKMTLTEANNFRFKLYAGVDRSYEQTENPYVIFSPNYENLKNSTYISTDKLFRTVSLTIGEKGVGNVPTSIEVLINEVYTGIYRREMLLDAQDVSRVDQNGEPISEEAYMEHLFQRGNEELAKKGIIRSFSSETDPIGTFVYGEDFFLGDIIQVSNEYGIESRSRIIEFIYGQDKTGIKAYPIFNIAPNKLIVDENVTLRKYLKMPVEPQGLSLYKKYLGIDINTEIAQEYFEAVGLGKFLNIEVETNKNIILDRYSGIFIDEEITTIGYHVNVDLNKILDLGIAVDEISSTGNIGIKKIGIEIQIEVLKKGVYEKVDLIEIFDLGIAADEISSTANIGIKRIGFEAKMEVT